jgi:hypothetical protein
MPRRALAALAAALVTLLGLVVEAPDVAVADAPAAPVAALAVRGTPPTDPVPPATVVENPFLPENKDLSDCVSAVPQPGCGSDARGGWRQALVFGIVVVGLAVIGWRITRTVRRNRRELENTTGGRRGP